MLKFEKEHFKILQKKHFLVKYLCSRLKEAVEMYQSSNFSKEQKLIIKDGMIKRFRVFFYFFLSYTYYYLKLEVGLVHNEYKETIRELFRTGHIKQKETEVLLNLIDEFRFLTQNYFASTIFVKIGSSIPVYYLTISKVVEKLTPKLELR